MILHITNDVNKNFKNFFSKILLTFSARCAIHACIRITHTHIHTYTYTYTHTLFLFFLSFLFPFSVFPVSFSVSFPFLSPFLLKPPKIVHSCVSFPFPSQYTSFSLERNHERFFAVLSDFTNAF